MFFTRSVLASATLLSFSATTEGRVLHRNAEEHVEVKRISNDDAQNQWSWKGMFGKRQDQILDCPNDNFAFLLDNNPDSSVERFCNDWLNIAPATVVSEVTPTVTVTTSASETTTQTTTERVLLTTTIVETATISASASIRRRMVAAAAAQIESIASAIVDSVIASGTPASTDATSTTKSPNRISAEQGLATACSCKMVQPTATVTDLFTVPVVTSTVGVRVLRIVRETETITYTSTTSVRESTTTIDVSAASSSTDSVSSTADAEATSSASSAGESTSDAASSSDAAGGSSPSASSDAEEASGSPVVTTAPIVPTTISSENSTSTAVAPPEGVPVVTAMPISCNEDDVSKDIDQVVGGLRLGYSVYCNTELVSSDRIGYPINVESATTCAARCSLLNAQGGPDACQSAVFTPYTNGTQGGDCELFSAAEAGSLQTSPAPGSIAIVHTGTYANGDECAALNATSVSIDTSAIVASITSGGVAISTPGLITQSSGGGVSRTYVSANSTDASGYVHWSWYELYASSASWWAVYETSWACSATITRTIEQPATTVIQGSTITSVVVTTIIGNGYTTIISGDSTTTIRGANGGGGATFVPASTTGGEAGFTTFFSTAVQASTGTDGIVTPTPAPTPGGQGNVTVVEDFSTFFSTGTEGVIPPSSLASLNVSVSSSLTVETIVSSTATTLTISGANSTILSTGTNGIITPSVTPILETIVSSSATTFTISGSNATATSTGDSGVIPPSPSISVSESSSSEEWEETGFYGPKTSTLVVASSSVLTITSTGSFGVETPTVVTAVSSETVVVVVSNTTLSGNGSTTTSTSTATFNSTGGNGIITPTVITEIITSAAGTGNFTVTIATATANSTDASGVIPPDSTLIVTETVNSTLPIPTPTGNITTEGSGNFSTAFTTSFESSTGASGVIPPASVNSTSFESLSTTSDNRFGSISRTPTANITASTVFITPSSNSSIATETPSANTTLVLTVPLSTGFTSTIEIPVVNSSVPVTSAPSPTPTPPANSSSIFSESLSTDSEDRSGSYTPPASVPANTTFTLTLPVSTGSTTIEIPVVNSTISVPEITPSTDISESASTLIVTATTNITLSLPSGNITLIPPTTRPFDNTTAPVPTPTGNITTESFVSINYSTVPSFSTGNLSTILPPTTPTSNITIVVETPSVPLNSTTTPPASVTIPPVSLNSTLSLPVQNSTESLSTSTDDRFGSISHPLSVPLSTGVTTSSNATTTPPPFPTGNSTVPSGPTAPTTEACPSPTEFSFITREVIITTYTVETVPVVASTCISSDAAPTGLNGTFPSADTIGNATLPTDAAVLPSVVESLASAIESLTATEAAPTSSDLADVVPVVSDIPSAVSSIVSEATASATSDIASEAAAATPLSLFRRSGTLATQEQIDAACNATGNLILSPTLNIQPNADSEGWFLSIADPTVQVTSSDTANATIVRFSSAFTDHPVQLSHPVTLCPNTQYVLSGLTRQANTQSNCTVQFKINNDVVFTANPQTDWTTRTERFTAGAGVEGASPDLNLVLNCAGFDGAPVGADDDTGLMVGEVGPVTITAEQFRQ